MIRSQAPSRIACRWDPSNYQLARVCFDYTEKLPVDIVGLSQASSCTLGSRRVLFTYNALIAHPTISQHALISVSCWGASGLPTTMGTPMSTPMGTSVCTQHVQTTSRSKIGPVQSIGSQRSTEAGLDCWPHLKMPPGHAPRSHRSWDPRAGQLSRWASRSCMLLHIASVTSFVPIHKVGGILQISNANPR